MSHPNVHNKEMANEIVIGEVVQNSDARKRQSLLERIRLIQQRKSLSIASLTGKTFLSYHGLAPALVAFANNKRSSMTPAVTKRLSAQWSLRDSLHARRVVKRISQSTTASARASKDWELNLINGLLSDDEYHEQADSEEWSRFALTGFPDNESLGLTLPKPEPESIPLPPSPQPLEIQKISTKPCLRVVEATQVSEEVLDEFDGLSNSDVSENEAYDSDTHSMVSGDISPVSIKGTPATKLEPESWPLPASGTIPAISSPTSPLPHPLRSNPPERIITKSRSQHSLRSVRSNRTNRKAFVMQKNDSSLSIHSLGTTTTKSISDIESALDTEDTTRSARNKNRKFPLHMFSNLNLRRSNAVRSKSNPLQNVNTNTYQPRATPGFSMLTPVAETFETRKGSTASTQANADAEAKGKSAQSSMTDKKASRFVFKGALIRHGSRRTPG